MNVAPTQSQVLTSLRTFLLAVLPTGVEVIAGDQNRVAEPDGDNFVVMTPLRIDRLRTNVDTSADVRFTGSIATNQMTVTAVAFGSIAVGAQVFGTGVTDGTKITALGTGTGGTGTYTVSIPQTLTSRTLASGAKDLEQGAQIDVQLDFHTKPSDFSAADLAQTVSTTLRDEWGVEQFASQNPNYGVSPLHADDPVQRPFINEAQQYEWRWVVEAMLQADQVVSVPQQFADSVNVELVSVDAEFAP